MENNLAPKGPLMKPSLRNPLITLVLVTLGVAFAAGGIYVGETDDAPGAALLGLLLLLGFVALAVKIARRRP